MSFVFEAASPLSPHQIRLTEAKWLLQYGLGNLSHHREAALNDYIKAREDFIAGECGARGELIKAILAADDEKLCLLKTFLGGEQ